MNRWDGCPGTRLRCGRRPNRTEGGPVVRLGTHHRPASRSGGRPGNRPRLEARAYSPGTRWQSAARSGGRPGSRFGCSACLLYSRCPPGSSVPIAPDRSVGCCRPTRSRLLQRVDRLDSHQSCCPDAASDPIGHRWCQRRPDHRATPAAAPLGELVDDPGNPHPARHSRRSHPGSPSVPHSHLAALHRGSRPRKRHHPMRHPVADLAAPRTRVGARPASASRHRMPIPRGRSL